MLSQKAAFDLHNENKIFENRNPFLERNSENILSDREIWCLLRVSFGKRHSMTALASERLS